MKRYLVIPLFTIPFLYYGIQSKMGFVPHIPTWAALLMTFGMLGWVHFLMVLEAIKIKQEE